MGYGEQNYQKLIDKKILKIAKKFDFKPFYEIKSLILMEIDVKSFTTNVNQFDTKDLLDLLNHYIEFVTNEIELYDGVIEQIVGDNIYCIFGLDSELDDTSPCRFAQKCVLYMKKNLSIELSIGLYKGDTVYGFFGAKDHLFFATIGDSKKFVKYYQSLNIKFNSSIILSKEIHT
ncbi:MAG: hypothetical protein KDD94_08980, partial [Calditrichaeota bacterium]|nr:hypothetical protein [Calditrichota bacterium]